MCAGAGAEDQVPQPRRRSSGYSRSALTLIIWPAACVVRDANMGHQLAGGNSSWCPELESRTTHLDMVGGVGLHALGNAIWGD